ncbi:double-strand break repair helicase AddA [Pseudopontixanthobacter vadosimaris]|uniref:double-strand break repair helicase AddA n=1 Tax=Pseudopontixanthobacter vadosimaris TaxID=2726450 RepID=UPI00147667C8|nr:double-strand break repair helicase AddA [Pseudopontixanthobacter vadosimaris]
MSGGGAVHALQGNQALAVDPRDSVWLSASAGTGKTQVLSARVLRLLLRPGGDPGQILCLTFTKAGAAEMATRVNSVLASWVRMESVGLAAHLKAIGAPVDADTQAHARTLFAQVLDTPGGGLRIDTIHAFAQWLLAAFPEEAGLMPGTSAMEDRYREILSHQVLADMLVTAERDGDRPMLDALAMLSLRMGADGAKAWLMRCAEAREVWFGTGAWTAPLRGRVLQLLGLGSDSGPDQLAALCEDDTFACDALRQCIAANLAWGTKTGRGTAEAGQNWLAAEPAERASHCADLAKAFFTQSGDVRSLKSLEKQDAQYAASAEALKAALDIVQTRAKLMELADWLAPALEIGRRFALAWDEAKTREGLMDFDDQIRRAAALLTRSEIADWIRYKLDRRFDHILIDEAQDTNEAQWSIIRALTEDFFTGSGQREDILRTIFVVGDYKQAIFRFQGTSPENFETAKHHFAQIMADAARNAGGLDQAIPARELVDLGLGRSYRTAQPVLDFVDAAIGAIGHEHFGLTDPPELHRGDERPGLVTLWRPVLAQPDEDEQHGDTGGEVEGDGLEGWVSEPERRMADRIAAQVKQWMDHGFPLVKGGRRNAGPGDVMVLVRKRRELAGLVVARLHAAGVPVAGVDRLRLGAPLAVKDLMAAIRFAAQPLDDLSLANLLVSPLMGWTQQQLLEHGYRPDEVPLWDHLRRSDDAFVAATADSLRDILRLADYEPPQALLHWMLVGPWQARRRLVARLGREANDPIDELLNAAQNYTASHTASLQGFIRWFDSGEGELKRDAAENTGLVRVMTVHGSKGLQAPIVILADATGNPDASPTRGLTLTEELPGGGGRTLPLPSLKSDERIGPIAEAEAAAALAERQEHWRLLYVAMTRAGEALFIGGALGKRETEPAADSWYARLYPLADPEPVEDDIWGSRLEWGKLAEPVTDLPTSAAITSPEMPDWAVQPIGPEPRPPRPLAPSSAGEEAGADPPLPPDVAAFAARRGIAIHRLLERLPEVEPALREDAARRWVQRQAADLSVAEQEEIVSSAIAVLAHPDFADIFAPSATGGALAEVPLAATVDGQVIAGVADRLLVTADEVTVIDFKTARRPPAAIEAIPAANMRQMAAYVAALGQIYPGRRIRAAILYTQTPQLMVLPGALLAGNGAALQDGKDSFAASPVE